MKVQKFPLLEFKSWLAQESCVIQDKRSEYEVLRYINPANKLGFVHRNDRDSSVKVSGAAIDDYGRFLSKVPLAGRPRGKGRISVVERLMTRDGPRCFFCGTDGPMTVEHLLARTHGGGNTLPNLCLACEPCNLALGDLPLVDKMRYYETKRDSRFLREFIECP